MAADDLEPLLQTGFNIPSCISNYIHYKVWNEITYAFPNFNGATMDKEFHPMLYLVCHYLSTGLKLIPVD